MSNSDRHDAPFPVVDRDLRMLYQVQRSTFEPTVRGVPRIVDCYGQRDAFSVSADVKLSLSDAQALVEKGDPRIGVRRYVYAPMELVEEVKRFPLLDGWGLRAFDDAGACCPVTSGRAFALWERDLEAEWLIACAMWTASSGARKLSEARREASPLMGSHKAPKLTAAERARVLDAAREPGCVTAIAKEAGVKRRILLHDLRLGIEGVAFDEKDYVVSRTAAHAVA